MEAARGVLGGGGKDGVLYGLFHSTRAVLNSLSALEFGRKSSCLVVDSEGCLSEELFWILLEVEMT